MSGCFKNITKSLLKTRQPPITTKTSKFQVSQSQLLQVTCFPCSLQFCHLQPQRTQKHRPLEDGRTKRLPSSSRGRPRPRPRVVLVSPAYDVHQLEALAQMGMLMKCLGVASEMARDFLYSGKLVAIVNARPAHGPMVSEGMSRPIKNMRHRSCVTSN